MDNLSKEDRSYNMSRIRSSGTKPELVVEQFLKDFKIKYKKNFKLLPGSPDFYLPQVNSVIFVHGCFWHAHKKCKYFRVPLSNQEYWINKFSRNIKRDGEIQMQMRKIKIDFLIVWGCEVMNGEYFPKLLDFIGKQTKLKLQK